jgi:hypothetical protein
MTYHLAPGPSRVAYRLKESGFPNPRRIIHGCLQRNRTRLLRRKPPKLETQLSELQQRYAIPTLVLFWNLVRR